MFIYIIFAVLLLFVFAYYFSFEYSRYKTARMMAEGLGGRVVFKIGSSYMSRNHGGVEERAWIVPDDKMAWESILSVLSPSVNKLFLRRDSDPGFRFHIEPKTGMLFRTLSLNCLKDSDFNVPRLDESMRLRTNNNAKAASYFSEPEKQQAILALFLAGVTKLECDHGAIVATMKGISSANVSPERIDLYFRYLRTF
jgi:hypothetical protein